MRRCSPPTVAPLAFARLLLARLGLACLVLLLARVPSLAQSASQQAPLKVAVAANFTAPARDIAAAFTATTGHEVSLSFAASGQIVSQIHEAAPFEIFLSADDTRPAKLAEEGLGIGASRFTYAIGRLVLWSKTPDLIKGDAVLKNGSFNKLAIANPAAAPYGAAALETLKALGLDQTLQARLVQGNSIAQTFDFVSSGNAELGFIALSQLAEVTEGSRWIVPQNLYTPIRQDAILLTTAKDNETAKAFLDFLKSDAARHLIQRYGYDLPQP